MTKPSPVTGPSPVTELPVTEPPAAGVTRVTTLELFFDLVFVFAVTQLTAVLAADVSLVGLGRVAMLFTIMWWMYDGYAWLTNSVAPTSTARRTLLVSAMAGFLAIALAIPHAFGEDGWAFGVGYFVVNVIHSGLFLAAGGPGVVKAALGLAPYNLVSASLVLAGGFAPGGWRYALWGAALCVQAATPYLHPLGGFGVAPAHFVERHGLVVIVALGESIVAIGVGAQGLPLSVGLIAVAVLSLVLAYFLWWAYFGSDDVRAEHALASIADPQRRSRMALHAFGYVHVPLLIAVVMAAAGVKKTIGHPGDELGWGAAGLLGGGVALFLLSEVAFQRVLSLDSSRWRLAAVAGAAAAVPLGALINGATQLAATVAVVATLLSIEGYRGVRAGTHLPYLANSSGGGAGDLRISR